MAHDETRVSCTRPMRAAGVRCSRCSSRNRKSHRCGHRTRLTRRLRTLFSRLWWKTFRQEVHSNDRGRNSH